VGIGGIPQPTGPDLPHRAAVHATDGGGGFDAVAHPRIPGRALTLAEHDGGGSASQRLPPAQGGEGQTSKKLPETDAIFANLAERDGRPLATPDLYHFSIDLVTIPRQSRRLSFMSRSKRLRGRLRGPALGTT